MSVAEMERRFYELKGKLDLGAMSEDDFKTEVEKLRFQDAQSRWWMIGAQSGKWYMYNGTRWIPGVPPGPVSAPPPPEASQTAAPEPSVEPAVEETKPALTRVVSPQAEYYPPRPFVVREPSAPREPARPARSFQIPVRGPLLVGCAALLALVGVIAFWVAVDNVVPGRPISSLIANKPFPPATVTRTASAVSVPGGDVTLLVSAGDNFLSRSMVDAAIAQYQAAAQLAPSNATPLTRWSRALAMRGSLQDALAKAYLATQRGATDAEAQAQLAREMAWNGQVTDAIPVAEKAIQLDSKSANAHAALSEVYLSANRSGDAQTQAQMALQLAPQSAEAHRAMAWVLTVTGQKQAALTEWRQTVALEPDLFFRHYEYAEVNRVYFGNAAEAVPEYVKAIGLYGAYTPLYSRLGIALLSLNQPQSALEQFRTSLSLDPNNDDAFAYLGLAYAMTDGCAQAIPYFEQALQKDPNNSLAGKGLSDCRAGQTSALPAVSAPRVPLAPPTVAPGAPAQPGMNPPGVPTPGVNPYPGG